MRSTRSWGDGVGSTAAHRIADISFGPPYGIFVTCLIDGEQLTSQTPSGLDRAWDLHRGLTPETIRSRQTGLARATDAEVSEFLKRIDNPRYVSYSGPSSVAPAEDDLEDAFTLMARLSEAGNDCTCATDPVTICPNYIDGDEND